MLTTMAVEGQGRLWVGNEQGAVQGGAAWRGLGVGWPGGSQWAGWNATLFE